MNATRFGLLMVGGLLAAVACCQAADQPAAETDKDKEIRGKFTRVLEQQEVKERKYTAIEIQSDGGGDALKVLIPLREDLEKKQMVPDFEKIALARRLTLGQVLHVTYYVQDDWNWARTIEVVTGTEAPKDEKDTPKAKDDKRDHNDRRPANRHYSRTYNRYRNPVHRSTPKPQNDKPTKPQNDKQTKPPPPAKSNNMANPLKIPPMPQKIN